MYLFFNKGMTDEISYISKRYNKPNNNYLNNLYGYAMSRFLPPIGFKWIDPKKFDINKHAWDSSRS